MSDTESKEPVKILIADDMQNFVDLEVSFLRRKDCTIYTAADGVEALKISKIEKPDILLLDIEMPRMTGIEVCRILRQDPNFKKTPIIMISSTDRVEEAKQAGATDFWKKPITKIGFLNGVKKYVEILDRTDNRVEVGLQIVYRVGVNQDKLVQAFTRDISASGAFVITRDMLPVGSLSSFEVYLPDSERAVTINAEVIRVMEHEETGHYTGGMGLRFAKLPDDVAKRLEIFITENI